MCCLKWFSGLASITHYVTSGSACILISFEGLTILNLVHLKSESPQGEKQHFLTDEITLFVD